MAKKKMGNLIANDRGKRILLETIAGWDKTSPSSIRFVLRNGLKMDMSWSNSSEAEMIMHKLDEYFGIRICLGSVEEDY